MHMLNYVTREYVFLFVCETSFITIKVLLILQSFAHKLHKREKLFTEAENRNNLIIFRKRKYWFQYRNKFNYSIEQERDIFTIKIQFI